MTPFELFSSGRFQDVADQIDSGSLDPAQTRVLTVFNPHGQPFTGMVVFPAAMKWAHGRPLPPIRIFDPIGLTISMHRIDELTWEDDRMAFRLVFSVDAVPALGYKSYLAEYAAVSGPLLRAGEASTACTVVETIPSPGTLPFELSFG